MQSQLAIRVTIIVKTLQFQILEIKARRIWCDGPELPVSSDPMSKTISIESSGNRYLRAGAVGHGWALAMQVQVQWVETKT